MSIAKSELMLGRVNDALWDGSYFVKDNCSLKWVCGRVLGLEKGLSINGIVSVLNKNRAHARLLYRGLSYKYFHIDDRSQAWLYYTVPIPVSLEDPTDVGIWGGGGLPETAFHLFEGTVHGLPKNSSTGNLSTVGSIWKLHPNASLEFRGKNPINFVVRKGRLVAQFKIKTSSHVSHASDGNPRVLHVAPAEWQGSGFDKDDCSYEWVMGEVHGIDTWSNVSGGLLTAARKYQDIPAMMYQGRPWKHISVSKGRAYAYFTRKQSVALGPPTHEGGWGEGYEMVSCEVQGLKHGPSKRDLQHVAAIWTKSPIRELQYGGTNPDYFVAAKSGLTAIYRIAKHCKSTAKAGALHMDAYSKVFLLLASLTVVAGVYILN